MSKQRLVIIDFLRGIAVILMFITHSYRLQILTLKDQWLSNQIRLDQIFNFFMYIEPFTSALFLFLAGYSFHMAFEQARDIKLFSTKIYKKVAILFLFSWMLNLLAYIPKGIFIDHLILSSGILQAIGIALLLNLVLANLKKTKFLVGAIAITLLTESILEFFGLSVLGLNAGSGCLIPVIGYSFVGHLANKHKIHMNLIYLAILAAGVSFQFNWRYDVDYSIYDILSSQDLKFTNWNHSALGFILNTSILMIISSLMNCLNTVQWPKFLNVIKELGQHSLTVYVYHLSIIGLFYINSWGLGNPTETFLFIIALVVSSYYLIKIKNKIYPF